MTEERALLQRQSRMELDARRQAQNSSRQAFAPGQFGCGMLLWCPAPRQSPASYCAVLTGGLTAFGPEPHTIAHGKFVFVPTTAGSSQSRRQGTVPESDSKDRNHDEVSGEPEHLRRTGGVQRHL